MSTRNPNFLVVDDHPVLRQGVVAILGNNFEGAVVREAASVEEAVKEVNKKAPDAIIVDPMLGSIDATSSIASLRQKVQVPLVVFAASGDVRMLADSFKAGARACVRKDSSQEVLAEGINAAIEGRYFIDPALGADLEHGSDDANNLLTERQQQIMQLYADGKHTEKVAIELGLSTETVRTHTKRILARLNASTRTHAVAIALRERAID